METIKVEIAIIATIELYVIIDKIFETLIQEVLENKELK